MSHAPSQPTVLVKKADGTTVRLTLDEVKKMRSAQANAAARPQTSEKTSERVAAKAAQKKPVAVTNTPAAKEPSAHPDISPQTRPAAPNGDTASANIPAVTTSAAEKKAIPAAKTGQKPPLYIEDTDLKTDDLGPIATTDPVVGAPTAAAFDVPPTTASSQQKKELTPVEVEAAVKAHSREHVAPEPKRPPQVIRDRIAERKRLVKQGRRQAPAASQRAVSAAKETTMAEETPALSLVRPPLYTVTTHDRIVDTILQDYPLPIPTELQMRARALIVSLLRGVRDKHQFHEYVIRPVEEGGLGFTDEQAARLALVTEEHKEYFDAEMREAHAKSAVTPLREVKKTNPPSQPEAPVQTGASAQALLEQPETAGSLSTTTPVTDIFIDEAIAKERSTQAAASSTQLSEQRGAQPVTPAQSIEPKAAPGARGARRKDTKPVLEDMTLAETPTQQPQDTNTSARENTYQTVGPSEEMHSFALEHFRRLSADSAVAGKQLSEKFAGWKEESYLLYLSARRAWWESPLYRAYQQLIVRALNNGQTIKETLAEDKNAAQLTLNEFMAILSVNRALRS